MERVSAECLRDSNHNQGCDGQPTQPITWATTKQALAATCLCVHEDLKSSYMHLVPECTLREAFDSTGSLAKDKPARRMSESYKEGPTFTFWIVAITETGHCRLSLIETTQDFCTGSRSRDYLGTWRAKNNANVFLLTRFCSSK